VSISEEDASAGFRLFTNIEERMLLFGQLLKQKKSLTNSYEISS
jgi:hypothetical protein